MPNSSFSSPVFAADCRNGMAGAGVAPLALLCLFLAPAALVSQCGSWHSHLCDMTQCSSWNWCFQWPPRGSPNPQVQHSPKAGMPVRKPGLLRLSGCHAGHYQPLHRCKHRRQALPSGHLLGLLHPVLEPPACEAEPPLRRPFGVQPQGFPTRLLLVSGQP